MLGGFTRLMLTIATCFTLTPNAIAAPHQADPAITYANRNAAAGIHDREGWFGTGVTVRHWQQSYGSLIAAGGLTTQEGDVFRQALADPLAVNGGMNWYRTNLSEFASLDTSWRWPADNPGIKVPALLIWGEADRTFVRAAADRILDYADNVTVIHLPGINHWAIIEQPELANRAIEAFLGTHAPVGRVTR